MDVKESITESISRALKLLPEKEAVDLLLELLRSYDSVFVNVLTDQDVEDMCIREAEIEAEQKSKR